MELRGHRRANKPQSGLFSRHYFNGEEEQGSERSFRRKAETETNGLWDDDGARGTAPCPERSDAKQPGHSDVRAVRSAGRAYRAYPV